MEYDFDRQIQRIHTDSMKWDEAERLFGDKDVLPMWVADMDFSSPPAVIEAIQQRAEHGIFGYATRPASYDEAIIDWLRNRQRWTVDKEWLLFSPGVVPALSIAVTAFTEPNDKILIQPPVYYPFFEVIRRNERQIVNNRLIFEDGAYAMDFEDLEQGLASGVKMMILCSPHNPVGRVWRKEELLKVGELCQKHHVLLISDEIHSDLVYKDQVHTPFASISEAFSMNSITCISPSKTFNLAGLQTAAAIIPDAGLRRTFSRALGTSSLSLINNFGLVAAQSAYRQGAEWLDELLDYLHGNLHFLTDFIAKRIPIIKVIQPEGTYLVWLDCRELRLEPKELERFMLREAKVGFSQGTVFGPGGEGFVRMNIACPRALVEEGLSRVENAVGRM